MKRAQKRKRGGAEERVPGRVYSSGEEAADTDTCGAAKKERMMKGRKERYVFPLGERACPPPPTTRTHTHTLTHTTTHQTIVHILSYAKS